MSAIVIHNDVDETNSSRRIIAYDVTGAEALQRAEAAKARVLEIRAQAEARMAMKHFARVEDHEERRAREVREADVTEAARRSQAEIRRHVDSYLKEHFEGLIGQITDIVVARMSERLADGLAGVQEANAVQVDRMEANVRKQMREFEKRFHGQQGAKQRPASKAR